MTAMRAHRLLILATLASLAACASAPDDAPPPASAAAAPAASKAPVAPTPPAAPAAPAPAAAPTLEGTRWSLVAATDGVLEERALESRITLVFADGRASGYGGCNNYSADYTFDGTRLTLGAVSATKRGCADPAGEIEKAWFAALATPLEVRSTPTTLTLWDQRELSMRFGVAPAESPEAASGE